MGSFLEDLIMGTAETDLNGFYFETPLSSPRSDKVKERAIRENVKKRLGSDRNALMYWQRDETISDEEKAEIDKKINSLDPSDRLAAELSYADARDKESQNYINAARAKLAEERKGYDNRTSGNPLEREYREAIDQETGVYTTGDMLGLANVVSNINESYDYYTLTGESPAAAILHSIFKGEGRAVIRDRIKGMTPEMRAIALKEVARIATENSVLDVGYEDRLTFAEKLLKDDYTNFDRSVDNAMSVVDLLFGSELNALTKGAVAMTKPFARRFAGFASEAAKNKGFMKFLTSNESEKMAEEGINSVLGKSLIKQEQLSNKKLNAERAATKYSAEKDPEGFKKQLDLVNAAEEYFGWKNGSVMSPVKGGVLKNILEGSNVALKENFLNYHLAIDRLVSNKIADGTLNVKINFNGEVLDIDSNLMKVLNHISAYKEEFNVQNISKYLDGDEKLAKEIYEKISSGKTGFLYREKGKAYLVRSEITKVKERIADVYGSEWQGVSGSLYKSKSTIDELRNIYENSPIERERQLAKKLIDNYGDYDTPYFEASRYEIAPKGPRGAYFSDSGIVVASESSLERARSTTLHEVAHSTTYDFLERNTIRKQVGESAYDYERIPDKSTKEGKLIDALNSYYKRYVNYTMNTPEGRSKYYGAKNLDEFIATIYDENRYTHKWLKKKGYLDDVEKIIDEIQKLSLSEGHNKDIFKQVLKDKDVISLTKEEQKVLRDMFSRRAEAISKKLDGDWSAYFNRYDNNKPYNVISQMNPAANNSGTARAQAFKEAMDGEEFTSQGLDQTETILGNTLPSVGDNKAPMDRLEAFNQALQDTMVEVASEAERNRIAREAAEQISKLNGSNVDISVSGTEEVIKCTFSGSGNSGYSSVGEARHALNEIVEHLSNRGVREQEFKIMGANAKGEMEAIQEGVTYDKYYLQLEHRNDVSHLFSGTGEMVDKAASIWDSTNLLRSIRDYFAKASTIYPEDLIRPLMASFERREGFIASNFLKEATDFKKAFNKLDRKQRANVFTLIYEQNLKALEASRKGEVFEGFTHIDLKGRGFSDEEISAIAKLADIQKLSWNMKNLANARKLSSLGYETVLTNARGRMIGKEVDINQFRGKGTVSVFDSSTGQVVDIPEYALKNYKVYKFATAYRGSVEHFIAPLNAKTGAINWRFDETIGRIPGYCEMRMKQGLIYIEENGKVVGVTDSVKKAEDYIGGRYDVYNWRRDRNVTDGKTGMSDSAVERRHGIELIDVDINDVYLDPLKSMDMGIKSAASKTHIQPVIDHAEKDFVNIYSEVLKDGVYPESITDIKGNSSLANAARSMWNYIEKMKGVSSGLEIDSTYKAVLYRYGEKLGKLAFDNGGALEWLALKGEKALYSAARADLLSWSRKVVSTAYIALNPIRQFFLQGVQFANAYAVDPKSAHKLLMQVSAVMLNKTKLVNLPEEYKHFADLCERAGILTSQSSVGYISDAIDFAASMNNPVGKLFEYSAKGAMFGEKMQQMFHAAALYNKRVREFGREWFNVRKNFDSFIEEVRIMSGSQSPVERMPWENGILGAIFQFSQSPWKMNQLLFNRQLPKTTRAAILTNELLLFGTGTYGASLLYDNLLGERFGQGLDEDTREKIKDGLFGMCVNKLFGIKMDTNNFAPTNYWDVVGFFGKAFGYNETEMATWMAGKWDKEEKEAHEKRLQRDDSNPVTKGINIVSAPTASFITQRIAPIFRDFLSITGRGNPYDPKDIGDAVLDIGRISSGFNQATKAYIAYTTGQYLNSKGAVLKEGLDGWAALGLLMGLNPEITKEERSKAWMETAWRDEVERIGVTTAYRSCLQYLNQHYGKVDDLSRDANFRRDLEILKRLTVTWVNGDPEKQEKLDKYMSKELLKSAKGEKSDAYVVGRWLTHNLKKNYEEFRGAYEKLKKNDPDRANMVDLALTKMAKEQINREE